MQGKELVAHADGVFGAILVAVTADDAPAVRPGSRLSQQRTACDRGCAMNNRKKCRPAPLSRQRTACDRACAGGGGGGFGRSRRRRAGRGGLGQGVSCLLYTSPSP